MNKLEIAASFSLRQGYEQELTTKQQDLENNALYFRTNSKADSLKEAIEIVQLVEYAEKNHETSLVDSGSSMKR